MSYFHLHVWVSFYRCAAVWCAFQSFNHLYVRVGLWFVCTKTYRETWNVNTLSLTKLFIVIGVFLCVCSRMRIWNCCFQHIFEHKTMTNMFMFTVVWISIQTCCTLYNIFKWPMDCGELIYDGHSALDTWTPDVISIWRMRQQITKYANFFSRPCKNKQIKDKVNR